MALRGADATTIIRIVLIIMAAYLIVARLDIVAVVLLLALSLFLDSIDGFLALREESRGRVGFSEYVRYLLGGRSSRISKLKAAMAKHVRWGPRIDVAGDRITEYVMWVVFTFLGVIPLFIIIIVIIRHSFADAFMGARGTSSGAFSWFSRVFYTSNWSRAVINVLKFVAFAYLAAVYILTYPLYIGYILVGILVAFILLRGGAEVYDSVSGSGAKVRA